MSRLAVLIEREVSRVVEATNGFPGRVGAVELAPAPEGAGSADAGAVVAAEPPEAEGTVALVSGAALGLARLGVDGGAGLRERVLGRRVEGDEEEPEAGVVERALRCDVDGSRGRQAQKEVRSSLIGIALTRSARFKVRARPLCSRTLTQVVWRPLSRALQKLVFHL